MCLDRDGCRQRRQHVPRSGDDGVQDAEWRETVQGVSGMWTVSREIVGNKGVL